jgi:hypothetical protein
MQGIDGKTGLAELLAYASRPCILCIFPVRTTFRAIKPYTFGAHTQRPPFGGFRVVISTGSACPVLGVNSAASDAKPVDSGLPKN